MQLVAATRPAGPRSADHAARTSASPGGAVRWRVAPVGTSRTNVPAPWRISTKPLRFEVAVGLHHGRRVHPELGRQPAHRRQRVARTKLARRHRHPEPGGDLGVERRRAARVDVVKHVGELTVSL